MRNLTKLAAVAWLCLIFVLLFLPADELPEKEFIPYQDKIAHFGLFGGYAFLWLAAFSRNIFLDYRKSMLVILFFGVFLGASTEYFQALVPGRSKDVADLGMDMLGLAGGTIFYFLTKKRNQTG